MAIASGLRAMMKTTAVRLSALYLVLFGLTAVALVFYMTSLAAGFFIGETRRAVQEEIASLGTVYQRSGMRGLVVSIDRRARAPGAFVYLVADPTGRIIAGNVRDLQPGVLDSEGWTREPFYYTRFRDGRDDSANGDGDGQPDIIADKDRPHAMAQIFRFENGLLILVGRDLGEPQRFRTVVRRALALALGLMGIGGLLIWFFVGRRALKRIDAVSQASSGIIAGDLSRRLPVSGSNDEFDRLSDSLNALLARIEHLNTGLREVSDSIAHDLKTPLTRLRNRAEEALRKAESPQAWRSAIENMVGEADQLIGIFNAMLQISRVEAGYTKFEAAPVDLAMVAADVADLYEPLAEEAGGSLVSDVREGLVVSGSRELIGQALTNLVDNAIKYGTDPQAGEASAITLSATSKAGTIRLTVTDAGKGIPAEDRKRAVRRFVRLDESRSQPGSGLGLSLVDAIMRQHGGSLELETAPSGGLAASLVFPVEAVGPKSPSN